jgi:diphthamide synthase (EF-2-diphthine--ammonia ligase)
LESRGLLVARNRRTHRNFYDIVGHDGRRRNKISAGTRFDSWQLEALPWDVDPCGENGKFHTVVMEGPIFPQPILVENGAAVERDGFIFADIIPIEWARVRVATDPKWTSRESG